MSTPGGEPAAGHVARTALILPVPALEHVVGQHRAHLDASAASGVPAHLTALFPFVPAAALDEAVIARVAELVAATPRFTCRFERTAWFGDEVLWLEPEPAAPVAELTSAVWAAFPDHPPYEGAHEVVVPHVTVGEAAAAGADGVSALRVAEAAIAPLLPVTAVVDHALLVADLEPGTWQTVARLPLGPGDAEADRAVRGHAAA